jgi:hypothetical protein
VNASEIDFAWHVFIDHVVAWTNTRAKVPDDSEAEGLAKRALEIATLFAPHSIGPRALGKPLYYLRSPYLQH